MPNPDISQDQEPLLPLRDVNVLIVDDDAGWAYLVNRQFKKNSFFFEKKRLRLCIESAYSGDEAIYLIKKKRYSLILLDQHMPGMDGISTLSKIRSIKKEEDRNISVIFITADQESSIKESVLDKVKHIKYFIESSMGRVTPLSSTQFYCLLLTNSSGSILKPLPPLYALFLPNNKYAGRNSISVNNSAHTPG